MPPLPRLNPAALAALGLALTAAASHAADLTVDVSAKTVTRAGKNIELTSREFALLEYMLRNKGIVLTREMIENNLWNFDYEGGSNVVDVYVGYVRSKLGKARNLIQTVRGLGYRLSVPEA